MPKVSVIIPTYNHSKYVGRAIEGVLAQTHRDFEIIVVDDGSTDNTKQVLEPYADKIKYIYQENKGLASARNTGIKASRGEYLQFLDADDILLPKKLEFQVKILEKRTDIDIVACRHEFLDKDGKILPEIPKYNKEVFQFEDLIAGTPFVCESLLLSRKCFDNTGLFDENLMACEDWDMWLRLAIKGYKFYCFNQKLVRVYRFPSSMGSDAELISEHHLRVVNKLFKLPNISSEMEKLGKGAYFGVFVTWSWRYYSSGHLEQGRKYLIQAIKLRPKALIEYSFFSHFDGLFNPLGYGGRDISLKEFRIIEKEIHAILSTLYQEDNIISLKQKNQGYSNAYFAISIRYYRLRRIKQALNCFIKAFKSSPDIVFHTPQIYPCLKSIAGPFWVFVIRKGKRFLKSKF